MQIERVEVRVVAPSVQRFTWSHDLQEQYMTPMPNGRCRPSSFRMWTLRESCARYVPR